MQSSCVQLRAIPLIEAEHPEAEHGWPGHNVDPQSTKQIERFRTGGLWTIRRANLAIAVRHEHHTVAVLRDFMQRLKYPRDLCTFLSNDVARRGNIDQ